MGGGAWFVSCNDVGLRSGIFSQRFWACIGWVYRIRFGDCAWGINRAYRRACKIVAKKLEEINKAWEHGGEYVFIKKHATMYAFNSKKIKKNQKKFNIFFSNP